MKGFAAFLPLVLTVFTSCETAVEPKSEFIDLPVVFGIITPSMLGSTVHTVVLSRSYDAPGNRPPDSVADRAIVGAALSLTVEGQNYPLTEVDDTLRRTASDTLVRHFYRSPAIRFLPGHTASLSALLPDGHRLLASTTTPPFLYFRRSYHFPRGISTQVRNFLDEDALTFSWEKRPEHLYWPSFRIVYQETLDSGIVRNRTFEVPTEYVQENGKWVPVYPDYTWNDYISYSFDAIDSAMVNLSAGNPDKQRFRIISAGFVVLTYDIHLSRYYASRRGSLDEYSIRTDQFVYSNIEGGLGVFGSRSTSSFDYEIDPRYALSFGYRSIN